ncbi:hypothetical protein Syun_025468 [Stephania yunnanensis]|uniref:ubiquitinyl hydrolase 1 n=1 Tax=Stephania yunnanensis TaxID=152371 RepID=A0AAP0EYW3_9MAGN
MDGPINGGMLYHEVHESKLCAVHCVNTVLQGPFFSEFDFAALAFDLDRTERQMMIQSSAISRGLAVLATSRRVCRRRLPEIGASEALSRHRCSSHPKPSSLFPLDLSAAFIKPNFRILQRSFLIHLQLDKWGMFSLQIVVPRQMILRERNITEHVKSISHRFQDGIKAFSDSPIIGEIRGNGLILGTEFTDNKSPNASEELPRAELNFNNQDIQRCPFFRNINIPTNFSLLSPVNFPMPAKLQMRRQELTQTTPDQPVDDEAVYYKVAGECPKECVYSLRSLWRKKRKYVDPDASASQQQNSDPLLIRDGSETEYNNSVSDPLLIKNGSETESNNSVSDPLLIRDGSETELLYSVFDPSLISNESETECNYNCTL